GGRLVIGPWAHGDSLGYFNERAYGFLGGCQALDPTALHVRWFDRHLKGLGGDDPPVRVFGMGIDEWRDAQDWPLPRTGFTPSSLRAGGVLAEEPPGAEEPDGYRYDPRDPVPTCGGPTFLPGLAIAANAGPRDQRPLDGREDVLTHVTPPLETDVEVIGPI